MYLLGFFRRNEIAKKLSLLGKWVWRFLVPECLGNSPIFSPKVCQPGHHVGSVWDEAHLEAKSQDLTWRLSRDDSYHADLGASPCPCTLS